MSEQTWTDEQVQGYLLMLDAQLSEGAINLDFEFTSHAGRFAWEWEYHLKYRGEKIRLSQAQAILVEDWIQAHRRPQPKNERDTHFAGWASLQWEKIENCLVEHHVHLDTIMSWDETEAALYTVIAQGGYDLVEHAANYLRERMYNIHGPWIEGTPWMADIPDMTALPQESE